MDSQKFCMSCRHTIQAAIDSTLETGPEDGYVDNMRRVGRSDRRHDHLSMAGFSSSGKGDGPFFWHKLQRDLQDRDAEKDSGESNHGEEHHVEEDSEETNGEENDSEEESSETESSEEEWSEEDSCKEDNSREDASDKKDIKEARPARTGSITPAIYVPSPTVEIDFSLESKDNLRHDGTSNTGSSNPFESDLTWASLDKLHQNCHHCVAIGNPLIQKDTDGFLPCRVCGQPGILIRSPDPVRPGDKFAETGPCCHTVTGILASTKQGCPLCKFLLKQLSSEELLKLQEPSRNGILRHIWKPLPGSSYKSFTYYYGCDQNDLSKYVARKSVHFSVDDSASELGLQEYGLESEEETLRDIFDENKIEVADGTTDFVSTMAYALKWLRECQTHHECGKRFPVPLKTKDRGNRGGERERLPSRLLYIGSETEVKLCIAANIPNKTQYMTLSHCWGKTPMLKLEKQTLTEFQNRIPFDELSQTFKDAIVITRKWFRCQYLWIDSLCIVQDDEDDWKKESALMSSVYSFSMLNIAAAHGKNGLAGCFSQRDPFNITRTITKPPDGFPGHIYEFMEETEEVWQRCVESAPLYQRGWVFQERMLAPRTIYFCKTQVIWGCLEERKFEGINGYRGTFDSISKTEWDVMVHRYSRCQLTRDEDKLVAISGLAQVKQRAIRRPYIAGLWENELPRNLLWKTNIGSDNLKPSYPLKYRAPSWSWAAINGEVSLKHPLEHHKTFPGISKKSAARKMGNIEDIVEVTNIHLNHVNDPFGQIASGSITLKGSLTPLHIASEPGLSIIEGREQMYKTVAQDFNLVGESYFDVRHRGDMEYFGMPLIGLWKRTSSNKNHVFIEGLLLLKVAGHRGTFRRLGTFTAFAPNDGLVGEVNHRVLREDDYLQMGESPHKRGFQRYLVRVI